MVHMYCMYKEKRRQVNMATLQHVQYNYKKKRDLMYVKNSPDVKSVHPQEGYCEKKFSTEFS